MFPAPDRPSRVLRCHAGFTLTELLLSMGIISVLSTIVIAAIGPREALLRARDAQRAHNVKQLTSAFDQYVIGGTGALLHENRLGTGTGMLATPICIEGMTRDRSCINIDTLVEAGILNGIPQDTAEPCPTLSGYAAYREEDRVRIVADHVGRLRGDVTINRCIIDTVAPDILHIQMTLFADTATITWQTDEPARTRVEYGRLSEPVDQNRTSDTTTWKTDHTVVLHGLRDYTYYHFNIVVWDPAFNEHTSRILTFLTGDTTAPQLIGVPHVTVTDRTATVTWETDEASDTQVAFGFDETYGQLSELRDANPRVTMHTDTLMGLTPLTLYHYQVLSRDAENNRLESTDFTFTTLPDTTPPVISGIETEINGTTVTFRWMTDDPATSQVAYGTDTSYGNATLLDPALVTEHVVTVPGLLYETQYHFQLRSLDDAVPDPNLGVSANIPLLIEDVDAPVIDPNAITVAATHQSAVIGWTTDEAATGRLEYRVGTGPWTAATMSPSGLSHSVTLEGLASNTAYTFRITSRDAAGNESVTEERTFTTEHLIQNVTLSNLTDTSVRVRWDSAISAQGYISSSLCPVAGCPINMSSISNWVHTSPGAFAFTHTVDVTGLLPGRTYILRPVLRWGSPYQYAVAYTTVTLLTDATPPVISGVSLLDNRRNIPNPTLQWNTDELTSAVVEFGPTNAYGQTSGPIDLNPMKTSGHSYTFPDLPMNAPTFFRITAVDAAGNDRTYASAFTTDDIAPSLVGTWSISNITQTSATITWEVDEIANPIAYCGTSPATLANCSEGWAYNWLQPWTWSTTQTRTISGLQPDTTYYVRLYSRDASTGSAGSPVNQWNSGEPFTITTLPAVPPPPDTTPPVISGVSVSGRNTATPTITWNTNEAANSRIEWGFYPEFTEDSGVYDTSPMKTSGHSRTLSPALLPMNSRIYIRIWATDAAGNLSNPYVTSFWTDDTPPSLTSGPTVSVSNATSATVSWTVNESAEGRVLYSLHPTLASGVIYTGLTNLSTSQSRALTSLTPESTYYYRLQSRDAAGNWWTSPDIYSFLIDKTPPTLSNLTVTPLSDTSVLVSWNAHEPAGARVEYGLTTAYGTVATNATLSMTPSVTLTNLTPNTLYHYRIRSWDATGNWTTYSVNQTFTTTDADAPVIGSVQVTDITDTAATVRWTTNEPATARVEYGPTAAYGTLTSLQSALNTVHAQTLTGLQKGATYHFRVLSADGSGNASQSAGSTFTTTNTTPPTISGIQISGTTESTLTIRWTTNEPADAQIVYSDDLSFNQSTVLDPTLRTVHTQQITGLQTNTVYHFRVRSRNAAGILAQSGDQQATTAADQTPPVLSNVQAVPGETTATITWTTNEPSDGRILYGTTTNYGSQSATVNASPRATSHAVTLTGLTPGTQYHFRAQSTDAAGNTGQSVNFTVTPVDTTPPQITAGPTITAVTATTATLTWTTNEPADTRVRYGETTFYELGEKSDATLATGHTYVLTGIGAAGQMKTYNARVRSFDAGGNMVESANITFTTDGVAPVLSAVQPGAVTATTAAFTWSTNEPATSRIECDSPATGALAAQTLTLTAAHALTIGNLRPGTAFTCRVFSMDAAQNTGSANAGTVTTPALSMSPVTVAPGSTSASFGWTSNAPTTAILEYGLTTAYGTQITAAPAALSHSLSTTAPLTPATNYFYRARSTDAWGQTVERTGTFTTLP